MNRRYTNTTVRDMMARMSDSASSFDEVAVSVPTMLFDLKSIYPLSALRDITMTTAGGTVTQADAEFSVSTDGDGSSEAVLQSSERARYVAGYDGVAGVAIRVASMPVGNQEIEWGNTDFQNGLAIGIDAGGMFIRLYSGGDVVVEQRRSEWLYPRPEDLDPQETNVYRIQYRWYGTGPYRVAISGIDDFGRGVSLPIASVQGDRQGPVTLDPNQPIAVRARNQGTTGNPLDVRVMGRQYFVMGDYEPDKRIIGEYRFAQEVGTDFVPLIAFRGRGGVFRSVSRKLSGSSISASGGDVFWQIRLFSGITGGEWAAPRNTDGGAESATEFNVGATAVDGEGVQIFGGDFAVSGQGNSSRIASAELPTLDVPSAADADVVALVARSISGTATVSSALRVQEEW